MDVAALDQRVAGRAPGMFTSAGLQRATLAGDLQRFEGDIPRDETQGRRSGRRLAGRRAPG